MSDTSGRSLPLPLMRFDLASSSWRTCEDTSLWDLAMSSPTFPEWGTTRAGVLFELPTPVRPTVEQGSSSLPTPKASDGERGRDLPRLRPDERSRELATVVNCLPTPHAGLGERGRDGVYPNERGQQDLQHAISALLPTPTASDTNGIGSHGTGGPDLRTAMSLLPTPTAVQGRNATSGRQPEAVFNTGTTLQDLVFDGSLSNGVSTRSQLIVGNESSDEQHQTPLSSDSTDDHDSTLFSWNG